jgi:hypothetical protein
VRRPGDVPTVLEGHTESVLAVTFSPDGAWLASGGQDGSARLWDLRRPGSEPVVLEGHAGAVTGVVFNTADQTLVSSHQDGGIRAWARTELLAELVCRKVWRNLSMDEWQQYVGGDVPYERTCPNLPAGAGAPANAPATIG